MAEFSKETVQRLAVLRALSLWRKGANGPVRIHKTLFFADKSGNAEGHLFTFRKWHLGQYSDEIAESLNQLRKIGRITCLFEGPSDRLRAEISGRTRNDLATFFQEHFCQWHDSLKLAFSKWAYLNDDAIITRANDDPSYTRKQHGEVIFSSFTDESLEFKGLDADLAERLADLVDVRLYQGIEKRLAAVVERPAKAEDWRSIYFGEPQGRTRRRLPA